LSNAFVLANAILLSWKRSNPGRRGWSVRV
jgi:hypothetical protein